MRLGFAVVGLTLAVATQALAVSMVSVPFDPDGMDAASLFQFTVPPNGRAPIATFDQLRNSYRIYPDLPGDNGKQLLPGRGYWVGPNNLTLTQSSGKPLPSPFSISLVPGWNMIGDPFDATLSTGDLEVTAEVAVGTTPAGTILDFEGARTSGLVPVPLYRFDSARQEYIAATTLQPFQGYWIYIDPVVSGDLPVALTFIRPSVVTGTVGGT